MYHVPSDHYLAAESNLEVSCNNSNYIFAAAKRVYCAYFSGGQLNRMGCQNLRATKRSKSDNRSLNNKDRAWKREYVLLQAVRAIK